MYVGHYNNTSRSKKRTASTHRFPTGFLAEISIGPPWARGLFSAESAIRLMCPETVCAKIGLYCTDADASEFNGVKLMVAC
jgi:hypothetical protein